MLTSFEDLYFEDNTALKYNHFDTDNLLLLNESLGLEDENGMLIEARLDDFISSDKPENEFPSAFHQINQETSTCCLKITKRNYRFPRESKNYFKNIGPKLKEFIISNFSHLPEIMNHPLIQKYLSIKNQSHTKLHIQQLCKSRQGHTIAKTFFKNFKWAKSLIYDDLRSYLRLNSDWNS